MLRKPLLPTLVTLVHQLNLPTLIYMLPHLTVHSTLDPVGPAPKTHKNTGITMMSVPLKLAVVPLPMRPLLSSLSLATIGPGVGRARALWVPVIRGSSVGAIPTIVVRVRSTRIVTMVSTAPATARARRCWRFPQGNRPCATRANTFMLK